MLCSVRRTYLVLLVNQASTYSCSLLINIHTKTVSLCHSNTSSSNKCLKCPQQQLGKPARRPYHTSSAASTFDADRREWTSVVVWPIDEKSRSVTLMVIIVIIIATTMFMVLSSWPKSLREFTQFIRVCRLSAGWPPTPDQANRLPPKIGSYHPHPPSPLLLLLSR